MPRWTHVGAAAALPLLAARSSFFFRPSVFSYGLVLLLQEIDSSLFLLLIFGNEVFYERSPESPQRTIRKTAQRFCCISALPLVFLKLLISVSSRICVALAIVPCTRQQIRAIAVRTHERARCDSRTPSSAFNWARQLLKCAPALDMFR